MPLATVGGKTLCTGGPITAAIVAAINGKKIARIGDSCANGGKLVQGVPWLTFE